MKMKYAFNPKMQIVHGVIVFLVAAIATYLATNDPHLGLSTAIGVMSALASGLYICKACA